MRRRQFLHNTAVTLAGAVLTLPNLSCSQASVMKSAELKIRTGRIQGSVVDGVHQYLGIPYAEPPFGQYRFLPATPRRPWDGLLEASEYGAICPQTGGIQIGLPDEGEDCLNLNVWTPDPTAKGMPVMVWAHGGGQVSGSGASEIYAGTHFAKEGVVLVTNNRRLGAEGYLYLSDHFDGGVGPGNLGILDQIEVLRWVQENIEQFGGDPNNVTLFGESGGGAATQAVVATPESKGLVNRVILQSGGHAAQRPENASAIAAYALDKLGINKNDLDALRQVPWQALVDIYDDLQKLEFGLPQVYLPVLSDSMTIHPVDVTHAGIGSEIDYLVGTCQDEINLFSALIPGGLEGTQFDLRARKVLEAGAVDRDLLAAVYQQARPELDEEEIANLIMGEMWFRVPGIRIADGHCQNGPGKTYMYLFTWESQFLGAAHAMDLMVFGNGIPLEALTGFTSHEKTAHFMRKAWVSFAGSGNPGPDSFSWPEYDLDTRQTARIDESPTILQDPYLNQRQLLKPVLSGNWQEMGL
jgi:carboxylesterase type B